MPLKIIIIGSGLAGLTAAAILSHSNPHHITLYERGTSSTATGGQGIIITPNGVNILSPLGFSPTKAGAAKIGGIRTYEKNGALKESFETDMKGKFGAEILAMKRSDFREELMRVAKLEGRVKMVFEKGVVALDPESGVVELSDGSRDEADVVVVADGVHSRLRSSIVGPGYNVRKAGLTCYRTVVSRSDAEKALGNEPLPQCMRPEETCSSVIYSGDSTGRVITVYPIKNSTAFNISCILKKDDSNKPENDSWHADGSRSQMIEAFANFQDTLVKALSCAQEVKVWELQDLEALPTWTKGRAILIGDAAHAMTPMQGQGANMSVEDGEALSLLKAGTTREEVPKVLELIGAVRRERTAQVLAETRKSHSGVGVAERAARNMEFNCGYKGIQSALAARENSR